MLAYRLASRRYEPDSGAGAKLYGGRWNRIGTAVIYTSATRSLAAVELIAHHGAIPCDYRVIVFDIPDDFAITAITTQELPDAWPDEASIEETARRGSDWAVSLATAVLRVPSAVFPAEFNYILNPLHPDFAAIRVEAPGAEYIDARLRP